MKIRHQLLFLVFAVTTAFANLSYTQTTNSCQALKQDLLQKAKQYRELGDSMLVAYGEDCNRLRRIRDILQNNIGQPILASQSLAQTFYQTADELEALHVAPLNSARELLQFERSLPIATPPCYKSNLDTQYAEDVLDWLNSDPTPFTGFTQILDIGPVAYRALGDLFGMHAGGLLYISYQMVSDLNVALEVEAELRMRIPSIANKRASAMEEISRTWIQ